MGYTNSAKSSNDSRQARELSAVVSKPARPPAASVSPIVPAYLRQTYRWAYLDPRNVHLLDRDWVVKSILWQQHRRLENATFSELEPGQHVLQAACVYGDFSKLLAEHIGCDGKLDIVDVAAIQVANCRRKLADNPHATVRCENVLHIRDRSLDAVVCYFLLHELPGDYKRGVTAVLLNAVRPGGKVVFVDYHKPHWAHPLKPLTSLVFDMLEPYAKDLWRQEIAEFASSDCRFDWRKETFFGGLFQKVVATRRS